jgi:hypothetical protein
VQPPVGVAAPVGVQEPPEGVDAVRAMAAAPAGNVWQSVGTGYEATRPEHSLMVPVEADEYRLTLASHAVPAGVSQSQVEAQARMSFVLGLS